LKSNTKVIRVVFALIGLGILAGDYVLYARTDDFVSHAKTAVGKVNDLVFRSSSSSSSSSSSGSYFPVVEFQDDRGQQVVFESNMGSGSPDYHPGDAVEVLFDPTDSHNARINSFLALWGVVLFVSIFGGVFFLTAAGIFAILFYKSRRREWLQSNGETIVTQLQSVFCDQSITVNGRSPFKIVSEWRDPLSGQMRVFKSESIWCDPTPWLASKNVNVLIDPGHPRRYWLDTSFLPKDR